MYTFSSGVDTSFSSKLNTNFKHNFAYSKQTGTSALTNPSVSFTPTSSSSVVMIFANYNLKASSAASVGAQARLTLTSNVAGSLWDGVQGKYDTGSATGLQADYDGNFSVSTIWIGTLAASAHTLTGSCTQVFQSTPNTLLSQEASLLVFEFLP